MGGEEREFHDRRTELCKNSHLAVLIKTNKIINFRLMYRKSQGRERGRKGINGSWKTFGRCILNYEEVSVLGAPRNSYKSSVA